MKVLWLSFTAAGATKIVKSDIVGCGWIESLQNSISRVPGITLGVGFFQNSSQFTFSAGGVQYYPINKRFQGLGGKIAQRLSIGLSDHNPSGIKAVIEDFKPDVIHLFGTESGMAHVLKLTTIPVVVHIQGLVGPYLSSWFPKGISQLDVLFNSRLKPLLFRSGLYFQYTMFKKRALREKEAIHAATNFFGRTSWDRNFIGITKPHFKYVHCDEVLRPGFYQHQWIYKKYDKLRLITVINPEMYKGLEIVLETASILKRVLKLNFEWRIVGVDRSHEVAPLIERAIRLKFSDNSITLLGAKPQEEVINELLKSNAFIHTSHIDNSPNSVCEAMLLGMPVIATNVGGISSLLEHQIEGLLYNSFDCYELVGIIHTLITQQELFQKMGENARVRAIARHNVTKITDTVIGTYKELAQPTPKPAFTHYKKSLVNES